MTTNLDPLPLKTGIVVELSTLAGSHASANALYVTEEVNRDAAGTDLPLSRSKLLPLLSPVM
jgi:hypothetical protein